METIQIRVSKGVLDKVDELVATKVYASRSDVIREAVRKFVLEIEPLEKKSAKATDEMAHIYHL